jgi:hypothetical protein
MSANLRNHLFGPRPVPAETPPPREPADPRAPAVEDPPDGPIRDPSESPLRDPEPPPDSDPPVREPSDVERSWRFEALGCCNQAWVNVMAGERRAFYDRQP